MIITIGRGPPIDETKKPGFLHPKGFPRYRDKADSLSALVNDILDEKKLRPTKRHSLYSLRHCFEDRLTDVDAPGKIIATLMGHKWSRPKYGRGPTLEHKQRWMLKIAFRPPTAWRRSARLPVLPPRSARPTDPYHDTIGPQAWPGAVMGTNQTYFQDSASTRLANERVRMMPFR